MSKTKQADGEIHEDQLLNFLVNRLDEKVSLSLANNAEITAEDIYEVLVGTFTDGTSVSTLCASSQNTPAANTILYHLRTKFEPIRLEQVANTLLRKNLDKLLPEQVEVYADLHLRPYHPSLPLSRSRLLTSELVGFTLPISGDFIRSLPRLRRKSWGVPFALTTESVGC